jgi:hypothetical protein
VRKADLLPAPSYRVVKRWIAELLANEPTRTTPQPDDAAAKSAKVLLDLPVGTPEHPQSGRRSRQGNEQHDAVSMLKWLRFSRHLHSQSDAIEAVDDAIGAVIDDDGLKDTVQEWRTSTPSRNQLKRGRLHLDATTMNMERRYFADLIENRPDSVSSMHLYSDASPVSGTEVQGMVMDVVYITRLVCTMIMPGVALVSGMYGVFSKAFALLWSLFLWVGPWERGLNYMLSKIRSLTTDMGTEHRLTEVPNLVPGFLKWLRGAAFDGVKAAIDYTSRLFPNALIISGWSHLFGNVMTSVPPRRPAGPGIVS